MLLLIQTPWRRKHCFVLPTIQGWEHMGMLVVGYLQAFPPRSVPVSSLAQHSRLDNSIWRAHELSGRAHTGREMETQ